MILIINTSDPYYHHISDANTLYLHLVMNWRVIVGLVLLILGVRYAFIALNGGTQEAYVKVACFVWIAVGVLLVVKGMTTQKKDL